jgi:LysR family transcriptional regulator, cell division regulator
MNSVDLKFFHAVVQANSIGGAAFALNTVQSNVTARIKALEEEIGVPLFHRSRRGVTLTSTGNQLVPYATKIGELLIEAKKVVTDLETPSGRLKIGSMETTAALRLPPILIRYSQEYPDVDVQLETAPSGPLVNDVLLRNLDGAFVSGPIDHEELESIPIVEEELVIVSSNKVSSLRELEILARSPSLKILAFRAGCSYRRRMDAYLTECGAADIRWMELGTLDGIIGCVAAGVGLAMLPRSVVEEAISAGRLTAHRLPNKRGSAMTVFIRRRHEYSSAALQCFIGTALSETRPAAVAA